MITIDDTIVAVATPPGTGGIAVIRISGSDAIKIADSMWRGKSLCDANANTAVYGHIRDNSTGEDIDECLATVFRAPRSFTGDNTVEISCHGSKWIQQAIVNLAIRCGARYATKGEFSRRAFSNGKIDLAQAEGIADLIAASSKAAHKLASAQANGHFSKAIDSLRSKLIDFASLLELELDFSEEEVEFADRQHLLELSKEIYATTHRLASTFESGSTFKDGVEVVIAGIPNAGKSTLLNALIRDDRAIVSDIPGTTRDTIEATCEIKGILFRFVDTAGLRDSEDEIERIGVDRARRRISNTTITIWVEDISERDIADSLVQAKILSQGESASSSNLLFLNKSDKMVDNGKESALRKVLKPAAIIHGSAKNGNGIDEIREKLVEIATSAHDPSKELMVTNARHYESLLRGEESISRAIEGIEYGLSADLIAQDVRETLHHLGEITGAVTTDTLLQTIFSRFCIGK